MGLRKKKKGKALWTFNSQRHKIFSFPWKDNARAAHLNGWAFFFLPWECGFTSTSHRILCYSHDFPETPSWHTRKMIIPNFHGEFVHLVRLTSHREHNNKTQTVLFCSSSFLSVFFLRFKNIHFTNTMISATQNSAEWMNERTDGRTDVRCQRITQNSLTFHLVVFLASVSAIPS